MPTKLTLANGRFDLGAAMAESGEAQCYAAVERATGRSVVVKVAAPRDEIARARLITEFERLAALDHPSLPEVLEIGRVEEGGALPAGAVFVCIERLTGQSAAEACATATDRARAVAAVLADAAEALGALHAAGLVHHDVKPAHLIAAPDGRFRLIDLGLVRGHRAGDGTVRGTLPYLSPDALAGSSDPAVDLFALGVTGWELLTGHVPYDARDPAALLVAHGEPRPRIAGPRALVSLLDALLALDPAGRPSAARVVGEELARAGLLDEARADRARRTAPIFGRPGFVASARGRGALLERLLASEAPVVALVGPRGSGRSRLVVELDRRRALSALRRGEARPPSCGPTLAAAAKQLGVAWPTAVEGSARARAALLAKVLDALDARAGLLHLAAPDEALVEAVTTQARAGSTTRVILELDPSPDARFDGPRFDMPPLDDEEVERLARRVVDGIAPTVAQHAGRIAQRRPGPLVDLLRAAAARGPITADALRGTKLDHLDAELAAVAASLPRPASAVLATLALLDLAADREAGRAASVAELSDAVGEPVTVALAALVAAQLVGWQDGLVRLEHASVALAALDALSSRERGAIGARLVAAADRRAALLEAAALAAALEHGDAAQRVSVAVRALLDGVERIASPLALLDDRTLALVAKVPGAAGARLAGELHLRRAEYDRAIDRLRVAAKSPAERGHATLLLARALRLAGQPAEAERVLQPFCDDTELGSAARVLAARVRLDRGDREGAIRALGVSSATATQADRAEHAEILGLASLGSGDLVAAQDAFTDLVDRLAGASPARAARADALLGMLAQSSGALEDAAAAYARALAGAEAGGDPHGAAVYAQNLGGTLRELGELARAEAPLLRACAVLDRLGRPAERALARFNLANLKVTMGDLDGAELAARAALAQLAPAERAAPADLYARVLLVEIARRRGDGKTALAIARELHAEGADRAVITAALAEALVESGAVAEALRAADALASLQKDEALPADARAHAALAEARVRIAADPAALPDPLRRVLVAEAAVAERTGRRVRLVELEVVLTADAIRRRDLPTVHVRLATALRAHEEMLMRTPELRRPALADDPDIKKLRAMQDATATAASDGPSQRLLEINKRLNSELDLDRLLGLILDTVLELTRAERGFVLIRGAGNELEIRTERNIDEGERVPAAAFSRSIADRAADLGEPIVTVDAAGDARFEAALSVSDLRLRSVLAVPLSVKGRVVGCVYVDHRARVGLFRPADVALVAALAEQAAIAVENARLLAENREREAKIRALNDALTEKLATQTVELEGMHREVREARRRLGVRYDYSGLIGQTPRMLELFRLLDRVTDTTLPVVIYGESGTGKELVARALHHNGPRRKAAFVSESCAAIPETLLEAALFGHVRGAFTGAQGERRGLFEIADNGTLFLDEVGEMSPAMQVRLLRVLQEGEFRRVGGEKLLKVDVRVVVASNRDLGRMVEEGKFREDLFYRLNVVRVGLPPLRERPDDIPLLVEHFLDGKKRGVTRRALERLVRFGWPGNVRQLENEIARAASMADGPIDLPDLSPAVQAGTALAEVAGPEPLDLKQRVERLERGLLEEALHRTAGNQSEAARLLGLSRFGLQKKLRRYHMSAQRA